MDKFILSDIDTKLESYNQFTEFYNSIKNFVFCNISVSLNNWFGANMCAVLAGLLDKIDFSNSIKITSNNEGVLTILKKNGFLANYGYEKADDVYSTTCRYLKLEPNQGRFFNFYVMDELLGKESFPDMSDKLKQKIKESIYEVFVNAQMHSNTKFIYTCGQFYPKKQKIEFTIVDTGIGFKNKINSSMNVNLNSLQAIKWALGTNNTTKKDIPGGLGLAILTEFIKLNKGKFQVISDNGFYQLSEDGEQIEMLNYPFPGTVVNMEFRTDDEFLYKLDSEININDIF